MGFFRVISGAIFSGFPRVADHAASGVGKAEKRRLGSGDFPHISHIIQLKLKKQPKDSCFTKGSDFKRAETKLREKRAAESGWKQDVSNRPLSRSDLAGDPTERRAFRVSFVRAAYGATGVNQNPGDLPRAPARSTRSPEHSPNKRNNRPQTRLLSPSQTRQKQSLVSLYCPGSGINQPRQE